MDLTEILSISGKPGLYRMLSQTKTGMIVESLTDGKRFPVFAHERISSLEEISIFTESEDLPLKDVFKKIYEKQDGGEAISPKSPPEQLKAFFEEVVPEYDRSQVYVSDMKKVISWYNLLLSKEMLDFTEEGDEKQEEAESGGPSGAAEKAARPEKEGPEAKEKKEASAGKNEDR